MTEPTIVTILRADHKAGLHDRPHLPNRYCENCASVDDIWDDPDKAVQIEDDDPESLAGDEVEFNETEADEGDDDKGVE